MRSLAFALLLGVAELVALAAPAAAQPGRWARLTAADSLLERATDAYRAGRHVEAGPLYVHAAGDVLAASRPGALYNAACSFALAGETGAALRALDAAVAAGWEDAAWMQADTDLTTLRDRAEWPTLVARSEANRVALRERQRDVDAVPIVTDDIPRFWAAVDAAQPALAARDTAAAAAVFERMYLDPGSDALLGYVTAKIGGGPRGYAVALMRYPAYYASVRETTLGLASLEPEIRAALRRMTAHYADAVFPPVGLVIGVFSSGGTSIAQGLVLGVEMNASTPDSPLHEMSPGLQGNIGPVALVPHIAVHELVHAQQDWGGPQTVLRNAILEGGADFLAELAMPGAPPSHYTTWGRANDRAVWTRFMAEKDSREIGHWTGNSSFRADDWTGDLGYYVGAEIARGYYERAADKEQAIRDLLKLRDPDAILAASGYAERYPSE